VRIKEINLVLVSLPLLNLTNTHPHTHSLTLSTYSFSHILFLCIILTFSLSLSLSFFFSPPPLLRTQTQAYEDQGCHLTFKKSQISIISTFWNSFLEIKWFGHLAFSWPFFNLEENSIFLGLFWLNFNKTYNTLWNFKIYLLNFGRFSLKIWPLFGLFHHLRIWPFLNCLRPNLAFFIFWDLATLMKTGRKRSYRENVWYLKIEQWFSTFIRSRRNMLNVR
jgi:hypothetical protein